MSKKFTAIVEGIFPPADYTLSRRRNVEKDTGLSTSGIYRQIADGTFPAPVLLGARAVAWVDHEVAARNRAVIAGLDRDQLRELVAWMIAQRDPSCKKQSNYIN